MKRFILVSVSLALVCVAVAQQKYAFLVGINKYYDKPGKPNPRQLRGCVNDAYAIKSMLENRFDFSPTNITVLTDADATKQNVVNGLLELAKTCKEGDAVVFYFSGHGVWMENSHRLSISDPIKQGMNQAMVMSDLYSAKMGCLLTDAVLKKLINKFIDKKAVVTTFFDCCFSGNLPMIQYIFGHNIYNFDNPIVDEKSIEVVDIFNSQDQIDSMMTSDSFEQDLSRSLFELPLEESTEKLKAFDIAAPININDGERIVRPSERKQSMFLSLAATTDRQPGQDIQTETGSYHGAFTYALLQAVSNHPSDVSFETLRDDIISIMKQQMYPQIPTFHFDPQRLKHNLIGIAPKGFRNNVTLPCTWVKNKQVTFNVGTIVGIKKGNILTALVGNNEVVLRVKSTTLNSAVGEIISGNEKGIKPGQTFVVTNNYSASAPLVKVFLEGSNYTKNAFDIFFKKELLPLVNNSMYADFKNYENYDFIKPIPIKNISAPLNKSVLGVASNNIQSYFVFLPIPASIIHQLRAALGNNQNIQLVNSINEADFALYLNYVKGGETNKQGFVFTYQRPSDFELKSGFRFIPEHVEIDKLYLPVKEQKILIENLEQLTIKMIRKLTQRWINYYPSKK